MGRVKFKRFKISSMAAKQMVTADLHVGDVVWVLVNGRKEFEGNATVYCFGKGDVREKNVRKLKRLIGIRVFVVDGKITKVVKDKKRGRKKNV